MNHRHRKVLHALFAHPLPPNLDGLRSRITAASASIFLALSNKISQIALPHVMATRAPRVSLARSGKPSSPAHPC